jgi:hypothetical protein
MKLSAAQRQRLLAGNYGPLTFDIKPHGCEPGSRYVLNWQQAIRTDNGQGDVYVTERQPLRWITVTHVVRKVKGSWLVRFDVTDKRHPRRLLRANPPRHDASRAESVNVEANVAAAEESFYTSDPRSSIDHLEAVPRGYVAPDAAVLHRKQVRWAEGPSSLGQRLDGHLAEARASSIDVHSRARRIQREIDLLARDLEDRAA